MSTLSDRDYIQYSRTMLLSDIGEAGQLAIMNSAVVIIGVGGLGHLVAHYLAAAGVQKILLIDHDAVELSNLPRQLLFRAADIGKAKVSIAKNVLSSAYPEITIDVLAQRVTSAHFNQLVKRFTVKPVVFDCTDNVSARQLINQMCVQHQLTLVSGAISAYQGQLFCIDFSHTHSHSYSGCYCCLYPLDTPIMQNCTQTGVLGPAVGIIASMQALVGLQHICNTFTQYGVLHRFNGKDLRWQHAQMSQDPQCEVCHQYPLTDHQERSNVTN
ncbi:HesA/MoeB/ThiF family protein [Shewanella sp. ALD9]|uniref:HesA/MoeB/ThiF family protein n=1 Tax=Shewanella sp. ALD9 TaxID=2058330 RepID=UPI000C3334B9|nr:HesA/MoeB/ThiF family protein [Shewanella sp. ALD9]PKH32517.1 thiamine biosynthesis protein ThiF [Shewanella sp. ALD9]